MAKRIKPEARRKQILEHFYEVLIEEGLEGASIGKIASHMGVHKSLVMHYFNKKEDIVVELMELIIKRYGRALLASLDGIGDPGKRLEEVLNTIFGLPWKKLFGLPSKKQPNDEAFYACYYLTFRHEAIRKRFKKMYVEFRNVLANELTKSIEAEIIEKVDPQKTADLIVVLSEGLNKCEIMRDDQGQSEEYRDYAKETMLSILKYRKPEG